MSALSRCGEVKSGDVDILIVPGLGDSGPDHWQSRWARHFKTARRVVQDDWNTPRRADWVARIAEAAAASSRPAVLVAHSLGTIAVLHAAADVDLAKVAGAFLVAVPDADHPEAWPEMDLSQWHPQNAGFAPLPAGPFPFPIRMIASSTDPYCALERSQALAAAWGADLSVIANAGHLNTASGQGPWPEGLLTFGLFLKGLA